MKRYSSLLVGFLALACLACGWYAWSEYGELVGLRAQSLSGDTRASLRKEIWHDQKEIADLKKQLAGMGPGGKLADSGGPADPNAPGKDGKKPDPMKQWFELMKDPEFRRLQGLVNARFMDQNFAGLYKQLNLSPENLAKFKALANERIASAQDAYGMAMEQGIDPQKDPAGFKAVMKSAMDAVDTQIKAVIGDDGWKTASTYATTMQQRAVATQLQQSLSYSSAPLTDDQANQVTALLAANPAPRDPAAVVTVVNIEGMPITMKGYQAGYAGPYGGIQPEASVSDAALNQAAGVLSQQQVAALKQLQQVQQSQQQLGQIMNVPKAPGTTPAK